MKNIHELICLLVTTYLPIVCVTLSFMIIHLALDILTKFKNKKTFQVWSERENIVVECSFKNFVDSVISIVHFDAIHCMYIFREMHIM